MAISGDQWRTWTWPSHHACVKRSYGDRVVLQALPGVETEVLLVDRGRDDEFSLDVANDAARQHGCVAERVHGVDREHLIPLRYPKNRHLGIAHERPDARVGDNGIE